MITFFCAIAILLVGYFVYGRVVERLFKPDDRQTPATEQADGVDYVPMPLWRCFLIQLLNIAGTGPIFGALMGAVFGPVVFIWIVLGSILGGAVHDYMTGMISMRNGGATMADIVGKYLGNGAGYVMRFFSILLLILVGAVFTSSPAALLAELTPDSLNTTVWMIVIVVYYLLATFLPIDKFIGRLYPVFGISLIVMAVGIIVALIAKGYQLPELTFANVSSSGTPTWPFMFITVACGAISGFHSTQSPLIARCLKSEKYGRKVFYGAMISESMIALVWAAAGVAFYQSTGGLKAALGALQQSGVVYEISFSLLGSVGGLLAIIGVIACPISSGDTSLRSTRLMLADWFKLDQAKIKNRLLLTIPLIAACVVLTQVDFNIIWRYFSWSNQTLAMITLWAASVYLYQNRGKWQSLICALPATFMSALSISYICAASEGFRMPYAISNIIGVVFAAVCISWFAYNMRRSAKTI